MVGLTTVQPDGLGIVDEDIVDWCEGLRASDGDEARSNTRSDI